MGSSEQRYRTTDSNWGYGKTHRYVRDPVSKVWHIRCRNPGNDPPGKVLDNKKATVTCRFCDPGYHAPDPDEEDTPPPPSELKAELRVLVCGSRTYADKVTPYRVLDKVLERTKSEGMSLTIIHGGARGADSFGAFWAAMRGIPAEMFPAEWGKHGKRAGYIRNAEMVNKGEPELVLAFIDKPLEESPGTAMMVNLATKAGKQVTIFGPGYSKADSV